MLIKDTDALVTGATGFIGGRLVERLWLDCGIGSNCLIQSFSKAARLARLPVKLHSGNVLDRDSIRKSLEQCSMVFNCAYGNTRDPALNQRVNEEGLINLAEVSLEKGIKRFVHISSVAVYGPSPPAFVDEETHVNISNDEYGKSKIITEDICHDFLRKGLPIVIIRPTVVFGPFSPLWTVGVMRRVKAGGWSNLIGATGLCNPVYIDDVVDGLLLCVENDSAIGNTFILSGDRPVTWNDFIDVHRTLAGLPESSAKLSQNTQWLRTIISRIFRANVHILRKFVEPKLRDIYELMKYSQPELARYLYGLLDEGIKKNEQQKFSNRTVYSIAKAKTLLGYSPRSFEEGIRLTADWLRYHEYI